MNDDNDDRDLTELLASTFQVREQFKQERIAGLKQKGKNEKVLRIMETTLQSLRDAKPSELISLARRYSVAITEYEKSLAFFKFYVVDNE